MAHRLTIVQLRFFIFGSAIALLGSIIGAVAKDVDALIVAELVSLFLQNRLSDLFYLVERFADSTDSSLVSPSLFNSLSSGLLPKSCL